MKKKLLLFLLLLSQLTAAAGEPETFTNPILPGFNPDPSLCRVGADYYLTTSSFCWNPGIPVYHSRDLVNWEIISHAMPDIDMTGLDDNDGMWAVTIRYHDGLFYLIGNAHEAGGNFFITAADPRGPWSKPVWIDSPGIDPSLFWDDDGRCYYTGNRWDFRHQWNGQCAIWIQEIDLATGRLSGERRDITYGYASNASYAEGPHIYKIGESYLLLMAEGGAQYNHAVTAHTASKVLGPYRPCKVNPSITHRQLGHAYHLQSVGHPDLVDTPDGEYWAVVLGNRVRDGLCPLGRETFLCKVDFEDGEPIFNAGYGLVRDEMERPPLPWSPVARKEGWYTLRSPKSVFYTAEKDGTLSMTAGETPLDSLASPSLLLRRVTAFDFSAAVTVSLPAKGSAVGGLAYYRSANGYFTIMMGHDSITLTCKDKGVKKNVAAVRYKGKEATLRLVVKDMRVAFYYGASEKDLRPIGEAMSVAPVSDNKYNKFNGVGIGLYALGGGKEKVLFSRFEMN